MKNLLSLGMMALLIATSCKEKPQNNELVSGKMEFESEMVTVNDSTRCYSSQKVTGSTYYFWTRSWVDAIKRLNHEYTDTISPRVEFNFSDIMELMGNDTINSGIRLFYVMPNLDDKIPSLGMVKTVNCNYQPSDGGDCDDPPCWLFAPTTYNESVSYGWKNSRELQSFRNHWDTIQSRVPYAHVPIKAYNYPWSTISRIINGEINIGSKLNVQYGLRTLGPGEDVEFYPPDSLRNPNGSKKNFTGYPVLVNILVEYSEGTAYDGSLQISDFDFAKPCPTYCD